MMSKRILSLSLFLLLTIALTAFAEEKEKAIKLEDIVVTATKTEKDAASAPGSISVVTKEDIEIRNIQTVDQALGTLPGIFSGRRSVTDRYPDISLRGIPGIERTLMVMDGITLNHPQFGGLIGFGAYLPEVVERIEVVKGPFSSLYGGHAMGGVVNIITRMPEKREFTIKSGYGSSWNRGEAADDLRKFYISYGDKFKDKLSIFLNYGRKETNGFPSVYNVQSTQPPAGISGWSYTTDPMGNPSYLIGDKGDGRVWDDNITLKAGLDFSKTSKINLSFFRKRYKQHYDDPHTYLKDAAGNPVYSYGAVEEASFFSWQDFRHKENIYNISYETEISMVKSKLSFYYVDISEGHKFPVSGSTRSGGPGVWWDHPINDNYKTELQFTAPLFKRHLLTFGGSFEHNSGQCVEYDLPNWMDEDSKGDVISDKKGKDRTYSFFVQDEIMILDNLTAYIGFRQDWWETYDGYVYEAGIPITYDSADESSFSPKVALVYKPFQGTTFRASAGKAFRSPTVYELYSRWISPTGIAYAGNPDLKSETTKSWDIGAEQALWKGAKIKATYYENYMEDLIYRGMTTSTLYENKNVGKAESKGIELEAEQSFGNWLRLFTNFTYTDSEVTENLAKPEIEGKSLTTLPDKMFNIGADLTKGPFSASLVGRYVSKAYINDDNSDDVDGVYGSCDPYFVSDAKVSYDITKFSRLSISVDNIFDEDYFYARTGGEYYKAPGRSWFGELTLRF